MNWNLQLFHCRGQMYPFHSETVEESPDMMQGFYGLSRVIGQVLEKIAVLLIKRCHFLKWTYAALYLEWADLTKAGNHLHIVHGQYCHFCVFWSMETCNGTWKSMVLHCTLTSDSARFFLSRPNLSHTLSAMSSLSLSLGVVCTGMGCHPRALNGWPSSSSALLSFSDTGGKMPANTNWADMSVRSKSVDRACVWLGLKEKHLVGKEKLVIYAFLFTYE